MIKSSATLGGVFLREEPPQEAPYNRSNVNRHPLDSSRNSSLTGHGERGNLVDSHLIMQLAPDENDSVFAKERRLRSIHNQYPPLTANTEPRVPQWFNDSSEFEQPTEKPHTNKNAMRKSKRKRATTDKSMEPHNDIAKRPIREARAATWLRPKMAWWVVILCWLVELGLRVVSSQTLAYKDGLRFYID